MAKQSNYNPDGNLVVQGNIVGDENIYITDIYSTGDVDVSGNVVIDGTLQVTGVATYSSDTVVLNNADGYVINANADVDVGFLDIRSSTADANVRLEYTGTSNTLLVKNDDGTVVRLGVTGDITASTNITAGANITTSTGTITGATITGTTITDGTATITGGVGTGFTSITSTNFAGTAAKANSFINDRTITFSGDVAGTVALGLDATTSAPTGTLIIQPNSVALGTDTTGNYVATITGGTGLTSTVTTGESVTPTINLDDTAVTIGTYGTAGSTGTFTVDQQGRITSASQQGIVITASQVSDFTTAAELLLSVTNASGDGSLAYNNTSGVFTYTGPSATEVRAHFTAGTGITVTNGDFVLDDTAVTGDSYGNATTIPTFTVDAQGRLTAATDVAIAIPSTQVTDFAEAVDDRVNALLVDGDGITGTYNDGAGSYTVDVDSTVIRTTGDQSLAGVKTFTGTLTHTGTVDLTGATTTVATLTMPSSSGGDYVAGDNSTKAASTAYVETAITSLIDGAPGTLNTLNEIAAAINDDANLNTTLTNAIATKLPLAGGTMSGPIAMATSKITGLGTPTATTDATTKAYVDTAVVDANTIMTSFVIDSVATERGQTDANTSLKVNKTMRIESPSMNWKTLSVASYSSDTDINLETEVTALDGGDPGVSFTPILNGSEHGLITIGKQAGASQVRQGNLTVSGSLTIKPGIDVDPLANADNQGSALFTVNGNMYEYSTTLRTAGAFVVGDRYSIAVPGTTDFTLIGAADNVAGTFFIATGVGTGSGKATHHNNQHLTNVNHSFFKHTIAPGESALSILGGNIFYTTKASEISTLLVSDTSGAGTIGEFASGNSTLLAKQVGVDQAHSQTFSNSTMYIGDVGNVSTYTTVQYGGSSYTTGNRPLERLTIDGGIILGARQGDDELVVNGTIFFDAGRLKTVEGGVIKNVTTASVDAVDYTTGAGRIAINDYVGGTNYLAALTQGTDITITKASNISANVISISANTSSIVNTAKSSLSITGANISYDGAGAFTSTIGALTTTNVAEGDNLYYTDTRARAAISSTGDISYDASTGVISFTDTDRSDSQVKGLFSAGGDLAYSNGVFSFTERTDAQVRGLVSGTGLVGYNSGTGVISTTADNYSNWKFTTDTAGNQTVNSAGVVSILGGTNMDVTHSGSTITISTLADITEVVAGTGLTGGGSTGSLNIALTDTAVTGASYGSATAIPTYTVNAQGQLTAAADVNIAIPHTQITDFDTEVDARITNALIDEDNMSTNSATRLPSQQSVKAYVDASVTGVVGGSLDLSSKSTSDLSEGSNLYYTDERAADKIGAIMSGSGNISVTYDDTADTITVSEALTTTDITEGDNLYYTNARVDAYINASILTTDVSEGTNLYWTTARGDSNFDTKFAAQTTTGLTEGSNLYYTNGRADARVNLQTGANLDLSSMSTSDLTEGTNEYFTTARARASVSGGTGITYNSTSGAISLTDTGYITGVTAGNGLTGGGTSGTATLTVVGGTGITANANDIALTNTAVTAGSYGDASTVATFTVDAQGRLTAAGDTSIAIASGAVSGLAASATTDTTNATNIATGTLASARLPDLAVSDFAGAAIQTGAEAFSDSDTVLMTAAAVKDKIESYSYSTTTGDITGVAVSGTGLSGGGTSGAVTITSNATSANTAGAIVARDASGNFAANIITGTATQARYADLAENYLADADYPPGTVLVLGGEQEVTVTSESNSPNVAGVVSTDPAHLMNSALSGQFVKAVALRGRVPVRVIGVVNKGDVLITSSTPGVATVGTDPHFIGSACIIGKAISSKVHAGEGIVEVLV